MRLASLPVGDFIFYFLNRQLALTSFFFTSRTECLTLSCCISLKKKGSSGIKLYYKLISYTHTHIPGVEIKKNITDHKKIKS